MRLLVVAIAAFVTLTEGAVEVSLTPGQVALGEVLEEKSPGISGYDNYERSAPGILGMAGARHEDFRSSVLGDPVGRSLADEQELAAARIWGLRSRNPTIHSVLRNCKLRANEDLLSMLV